MIKVAIPDRTTDVSRMTAKGWVISIFRGKDQFGFEDFITIEKAGVKFWMGRSQLKYGMEGVPGQDHITLPAIEIKKYVDGRFDESKIFYDTGDGITGTVFITENKAISTTYAFFRNASLMEIIKKYGLRRIEFPRTQGDRFDKTITEDVLKSPANPSSPTLPPFHTDGTYQSLGVDEETMCNTWEVYGASYVYEYQIATLTIPQIYDPQEIDKIMSSLTE